MQSIVVFLLLLAVALPCRLIAEPLSIQDAVRRGLAFNPARNIAASAIEAAEGERRAALSLSSPILATEYEGIPRGGRFSEYGERRISLSQEFEFPLKYIWRSKATKAAVLVTRKESLALLLDLESEIRSTYGEAWSLGEKVSILTRNVEASRIYASHLNRKHELGEIAPLEARSARLEYLQASSQLAQTQSDFLTQQNRLARMIGENVGQLSLLTPLDGSDLSHRGTNDSLILDSPELQSASLSLNRAKLELHSAKAAWLPDLELTYFQQKAPAEPKPDFWGVEVGISLPVWYWMGGRGEFAVAKANHRAASAELDSRSIEISSEIDRLVQRMNVLSESNRLYQEEAVPAAKEAYDLAMASYKLGEASYIQVIDAQRSALEVEIEALDIQNELYQTLTEFDRLAGRSLIGADELQQMLEKGK